MRPVSRPTWPSSWDRRINLDARGGGLGDGHDKLLTAMPIPHPTATGRWRTRSRWGAATRPTTADSPTIFQGRRARHRHLGGRFALGRYLLGRPAWGAGIALGAPPAPGSYRLPCLESAGDGNVVTSHGEATTLHRVFLIDDARFVRNVYSSLFLDPVLLGNDSATLALDRDQDVACTRSRQ